MALIMAWIMLLGTVNSRIPSSLTFMLPVLMLMSGRGLLLAKLGVGWKESIGGWFLRSGETSKRLGESSEFTLT